MDDGSWIFVVGFIVYILIMGAVILTENNDYLYEVKHNGDTYYVDSYTKENQGRCVNLAELETRICGDYTITKLIEE